MPIYEYRCQECGATFDKFVRSILGSVEVECPQCHSKQCRKNVSRIAVISMGAGGSGAAECAPTGG